MLFNNELKASLCKAFSDLGEDGGQILSDRAVNEAIEVWRRLVGDRPFSISSVLSRSPSFQILIHTASVFVILVSDGLEI